MRVTFQPGDDLKLGFSIRSPVVDAVNDAEEPKEIAAALFQPSEKQGD
jgi:hypothetical protein